MKCPLNTVLFLLLIRGVFGANEDDKKPVPVSGMEGHSVTLSPNLTKIDKWNKLQWSFGEGFPVIAQADVNDISYPNLSDIFGDRLHLNKNGSLIIKNMRTKHSGLYKLQLDHNNGISIKKFSVTVVDCPLENVTHAGEAEMKSVINGDPVILQTNVGQLNGTELIVWMFVNESKCIAKYDSENTNSSYDKRYRDRLKLDNQTGSLTITNTRTIDSGLYIVKISNNSQPLYKRFSVTVSGLSPGAKAGICFVVLLLMAAAAVVFYYRQRIDQKCLKCLMVHTPESPEQQLEECVAMIEVGIITEQLCKTYEEKMISVKEEESVTLKTDAEIQRDDQIMWTFGPQETLIAEMKSETREITTFDGADGRFRDKLKLDRTGSLTITNITAEHIGVYKLQTISSRGTSYQRFIVTVRFVMMSVIEGQSVTLYPDTEIQKNDLILWMFGDENNRIAQMTGKTRETYEGSDGIFKDRLKLDKRTGSLTISGMKTEHSGLYKVQMSSSSKGTTSQRFKVVINLKNVSMQEGESIILKTNAEMWKKDTILWLFGDENTLIAEIKDGNGKISAFDGVSGSFGGSLGLDINTGSLTIRNISTEHAGVYKQRIIGKKRDTIKKINVAVKVGMILDVKGKNVTLNPDTETQRDDLILWMFGNENNLIAQLTGETKETTYADADERFRNRLQLDKNTGSLTIKNITAGLYKLQVISSSRSLHRKFRVFTCCESGPKTVSAMVGECLILITDFSIERGERVLWSFQDKTLAVGMNADISKTSYLDVRFKGRLELHHLTGSLTIKNARTSDTGVYQLQFLSVCGKNICSEFTVTVSDSVGNQVNKSAIVMKNGEDPTGVNIQQKMSLV
ncbi:hypothetical protein QQF64_034561 [Cirrhinus molitorella]|uniref:Immunoglobulin domain-containing protein n=1 Tax=Cirrhinus molitorella TaxID=172907 RepID=A0ABR3L167_9TELE